ncbi:TOMM precursor leader peptide-binding protein [Streptomyces sp. NPDC006784]|uniref:TOMM precursor leader peptide-binding protein n=1 Tax=Streptomyces sp. NPDC006784 TaxID=3364764 RepID=UPI003695D21C
MPTTRYGSRQVDALHDIRPRLRADALFTATDHGVLLQYPEGQFVLRGRTAYAWMCRLTPHLTGANTVAELCEGLPGEHADAVVGIVRTLLQRGVVHDLRPPEPTAGAGGGPPAEAIAARFADQLAYLDHQLRGSATAAFTRFRDTRVLIAGRGAAAESCAATLLRNGLRTVTLTGGPELSARLRPELEELHAAGCDAEVLPRRDQDDSGGPDNADRDADVVVACGTGPGELFERNRAALDGGPALLPLTVLDGTAVIGPLVPGPGHGEGAADRERAAGCWQCAVLRLAGGLEPAAAAALLRAVCTGRPAAGPDTQLARMLGTTLAFDVFRHRTGALPAESAGSLLLQDSATLETSRQTLLAHPDCEACGEPPAARSGSSRSAEPCPPGGSGHEQEGAQGREKVLFGTYAGVFRRYADDALPQSPLRSAAVEVAAPGPSALPARTVTAFALGTQTDARTAARTSAALVYESLLHAHGMPRSAAPHLADSSCVRVPAHELSTWSGTAAPDGPDGGDGQTPWLRAWRWNPTARQAPAAAGPTVAVPAAAVHPGGALNRDRRFEPGGAGAGAGSTLEAAARAGLLSALAFEGVVAALRGRAAARILPVDAAADGDAGFLLRSLGHLDQPVTLLEFPGAAPAYAVAALATGQAPAAGPPPAGPAPAQGPRTTAPPGHGTAQPTHHRTAQALGHGTTRAEAVVHALRDLLGTLQLAHDGQETDLGTPLMSGFDADALRDDAEALRAAAAPPAPLPDAGAGPASSRQEPAWPRTVPGRDVLVAVTTPPDLRAGGMETVRVLLRKTPEGPE